LPAISASCRYWTAIWRKKSLRVVFSRFRR